MQRVVIAVIILVACPCVSATTLMGPSSAMLNGDRFGVAVEYSRTDADITFDLGSDELTEDFDLHTAYATLSAAAARWLEFYIRLGAGQADATDFDGDTNLSWGLGARLTAFEWDDFTWGAMLQFTNVISRFETMEEFLVDDTPTLLETEEELAFVEYAFTTGPTWQHGPLSLYGGLLLRCLTGRLDFDAGQFGDSFDIDSHWDAGGFVGGTLSLFKTDVSNARWLSRVDLTAEGRFTDDSTGFSLALLLPFGGEP